MATIIELEAQVTPVDAVNGIVYFSGDHRGMEKPLITEEDRAYTELRVGYTGDETVLRFVFRPAAAGLIKLDDLVYFNPPTLRVNKIWEDLRPSLYSRLAQTNSTNGKGAH